MEALHYNANKALQRAITVLWSKILRKSEYYSQKGSEKTSYGHDKVDLS